MTHEHQLMDCLVPPPTLEQLFEGVIWPARLMVCRGCWEVQIHAFNPALRNISFVDRDDPPDLVVLRVTVLNLGNKESE